MNDQMQAILNMISDQKIAFVEFWFTDITGVVKNIILPHHDVEDALTNGLHFDGSAVEGFGRVAESDMVLRPDLDTFALLPWDSDEDRCARLICSVHTLNGDPFIGDPRNVLMRVLEQAHALGFTYKTGMELEFFLFRSDQYQQPQVDLPLEDTAGYFDLPNNAVRQIQRSMLKTLSALNIGVASAHSEIGSGQHEIDFDYHDALTSADQVLTARVALKTVAQRYGLYCTFMPRPRGDLPGSGMHTHQSLHHLETDANVFADPDHEYGLSDLARHFLAGQLTHARAMCAVLAPLVNSYKRLGMSFEAPVNVSWAHVNRSALIRVPAVRAGREENTRIELRCPDPSSNPYLASAVMLQAGLDGIRQKLLLPPPQEEILLQTAHRRTRMTEVLPTTLGAALDALQDDEVILAALGPIISDRYMDMKRKEFDQYNRQVTPWEVSSYLHRY